MEKGNKINGFILERIESIPDYKATGYCFIHEKTAFEVYYMEIDDEECFFTYDVYTPPENDKGIFHILEHTLLTGSKKYPVRDPFMAMIRSSVNTFLNAMTGPDRTYFPAASPLKKDFDNIFKVYTDAVFDPLLRKESFEQEGIRLTRNDEEGVHFEGVVFSEMQGDTSTHQAQVSATSNRNLFPPSSPYTREFGGNPPEITDLTYEEFVDTYKKYYVPKNIKLFLYGKLDIKEKLEYLNDEYLKNRDSGEKIERIECVEPWKEAKIVKAKSNLSEGGTVSSTVILSWAFSDSTLPRENTELSILTDLLLGNVGSPLYKALIESGYGKDISSESGMNDSYRSLIFSVGLDGAKEKDSKKIESFILNSLNKIAEDGFDEESVEAAFRRTEFRLQEIPSGSPLGYVLFFSRIDKGWMFGQSPAKRLAVKSELDSLRAKIKSDKFYFSSLIKKWLINNKHRLLSVITMDKDNQKNEENKIKEKLLLHEAEYSEEDDKKFRDFSVSLDQEEDIKKLPKLSLSDIPDKTLKIDHVIRDKVIISPMFTNGVVYFDAAFDINDLSEEELEDLSLLSRLLLMTDVGDLSYSSFLTKLRLATGGISIIIESGTDYKGNEQSFLLLRFKALNEYILDAFRMVEKLVKEADVSNKERIKAAILDIESDYENYSLRSAHTFCQSAASESLNSSSYVNEKTLGYSFWLRVKELKNELESLSERLPKLLKKVFAKERIKAHITSDEAFIENVYKEALSFISNLSDEKIGEKRKELPIKRKEHKAFLAPTPVSYIASAFLFDGSDEDFYAERVFLSLLSSNAMWSLIREKGGAYGAGSGLDIMEKIIYFFTYRDPRLEQSIKDFKKAILTEEITIDKINDVKLRLKSQDIKPTGPMTKSLIDFRRVIYSFSEEERLRIKNGSLAVTQSDVERVRDKIASLLESANIAVVTSKEKLNNITLSFDLVKLPL